MLCSNFPFNNHFTKVVKFVTTGAFSFYESTLRIYSFTKQRYHLESHFDLTECCCIVISYERCFLLSKNIYIPNMITFFLKFYLFIYLIFGCVGSLLLHAGFLCLQRAGSTFRCGTRASPCSGFSCCGAWALGSWASVVAARRLSSCGSWYLEHRLSSCGARA